VKAELARYRIASTLETGTPTARRVAKALFTQIARSAAAPDLRAGAAFHLARLAADAGATELACKWAHRCLALVPCHEGAMALLRQPS
jgi:hypothetical protein